MLNTTWAGRPGTRRTAETDHSFYEAYKGLRGFVIQGNNISIKTRSNKIYNFQFLNPGDADRVRAWISSTRLIQVGGQID